MLVETSPPPPDSITGFSRHVEELHFLAGPGIGGKWLGKTIRILRPGMKRGLGHLQRRQNAFGQECA
jgi:hypothetical protein